MLAFPSKSALSTQKARSTCRIYRGGLLFPSRPSPGRYLTSEYAIAQRRETPGHHLCPGCSLLLLNLKSKIENGKFFPAPFCTLLHRFPPKHPFDALTTAATATYLMHHSAPSAHLTVQRSKRRDDASRQRLNKARDIFSPKLKNSKTSLRRARLNLGLAGLECQALPKPIWILNEDQS